MIERSEQDRRAEPRGTPDRRRRGRPALAEGAPSTDVHVRMPASLYDEAYRVASVHRMNVPELIRRALRSAILAPR